MSTGSLRLPDRRPRHPSAGWVGVGAIVAAVAAAAATGTVVTASSVTTWYPDVPKPVWTPPAWVFGPVWAVLYVTMAAAAAVVWRSRDRDDVCCPLAAFGVQLALNVAWTVFFFGLRSPLLGFLDVCLLWAAVGVTVTQFFAVSRLAGWLLVPYGLWVTFAAALNGSIVLLGG
ncbi:MAG: sensory protein TspO [Isosphaera sp.]|nr:sensory protein TspO [Isosphaera sp.]